MSKAFDCVDHDILLNKLEAYGIRGNVLKLIKSYLSNRKQYTEINRICPKTKSERKYRSEERIIKYGVPQGSVLGPPLFLTYINDLPRHVDNPMVLFADDSTAVVKCKHPNSYEQDINKTLEDIVHWLDKNNLMINLAKTNIMHFHQRTNLKEVSVHYNKQKIDQVKVAKFLGIYIDRQLNWQPQAEEICKRMNTAAYVLSKLSKKVDIQTTLVAYHGLVASVLRFGIIFWGNCSSREYMFKAQKRCIRAMCGLKTTDSCEPKFKSLKVLTFPSLYILEMAMFVKTNKNLFPTMTETRKRPVRNQYKNLLQIESCNTALMKKSVICMGPTIYNKLPDVMKNDTIKIFKKKLAAFLTAKCYYSINDFLMDKTF